MSKMVRFFTLLLTTLVLQACAEKGLLRLEGELSVTVWGGVPQSFASVGDEPEVQLGMVVAQDTQIAWFTVENLGNATLELTNTEFDATQTDGGNWLEPVRWERDASGAHLPLALPITLPVRGSLVFGIPYQAHLPADASARILVSGSGAVSAAARVRATPTYDSSSSLTWRVADRHDVEVVCHADGCEDPDGTIRMGTATTDAWSEFTVRLENATECRLLQGQDPCALCSVRLGDGSTDAPALIVDTVDADWELVGGTPSMVLTSQESCGGSQAWEGVVRVRPSRGGWHGVTMEAPIQGAFDDTLILDLAVEGMMPEPEPEPVPEPEQVVRSIQVLIDGTLGPAADTCTGGLCQWNSGASVSLGQSALGASQTEMIRVVNATQCPETASCEECQVVLGSAAQAAVSLQAADARSQWSLSGDNGIVVLGAPRMDCQATPSSMTVTAEALGVVAGTSQANFEILTDVAATMRVLGTLEADFVESDAPRIEVEILGDVINADDARCRNGTCSMTGLSAGIALPGNTTSVPLTIRNLAGCSASSCDACELALTRNGSGVSVSAGAGLNATLSSTPSSIRQASASCAASGEWEGVLSLTGSQTGTLQATLQIPSNDANAGLITISLGVDVADEPIAIADFDPCVEDIGGSSRCTIDSMVDPMEPVILKGDASFDPRGRDLTQYQWVVSQAPNGSQHQVGEVLNTCTVSSFRDCLTYTMLADVPGEYELCLEVENDAGATSSRTANSCASWFVYPSSDIHIQLSWPEGTGRDLDLHLNNLSVSDRVCDPDSSCNFRNCKQDSSSVQWFTEDTAGNGSNPRLDVDSLSGSQHENINIDTPRDGSYRVYVHYYASSSTLNGNVDGLVTVWIRGVEVFGTTMAQLKENDVWRVGDVMWYGDEAVFVPYSASDKVGSELGVSAGNDAPTYWCTSSRGGWEWAP